MWHKPENKEYDSQSDPHPEAGVFQSQATKKYGMEDGHDSWASWNHLQPIAKWSIFETAKKQSSRFVFTVLAYLIRILLHTSTSYTTQVVYFDTRESSKSDATFFVRFFQTF